MARRQNTSCDPCRETKRRCVISPQPSNSLTIKKCNNCSYLDRNCTFDFANARRNAAKRRMGSSGDRLSASSEQKDSNSPASDSMESNKSPNAGDGVLLDYGTLFPDQYLLPDETTDPHSIANAHSSGGTEMHWDFIDNLEGVLHVNPEIFLPKHSRPTLPFDFERPISSPACLIINSQIPNISPTSPINLLSASVEANGIKQELSKIYKTVMGIATNSFLSHESNPFATKWIYHFEGTLLSWHSDLVDAEASDGCRNNGGDFQYSTEPYARAIAASEGNIHRSRYQSNDGIGEDKSQVTMLGIATFLDNFAGLYGNILDPHSIRESEIALRDVIHAFSLQWLPSTKSTLPTPNHWDKDKSASSITRNEPLHAAASAYLESPLSHGSYQSKSGLSTGANIFMDSWFKARKRLLALRSFPSFKATYALLVFDMIAPPPQVDDSSFENLEPQQFLKVGLNHLSTLTSLVQSYCDNLGNASLYSQLLQAGLQIFQWFGYIRDTTLTMLQDRSCLLPDALPENRQVITFHSRLRSQEVQLSALLPASLDSCVQEWCATAATGLMLLWRQVIKFREHVRGFQDDSSTKCQVDVKQIYSLLRLIDESGSFLRPFIRKCLRHFDRLSPSPRLFFALIVCYWSHGVLTFTENIRRITKYLEPLCALGLSAKIMDYNWSSSQLIAVMAQTVLSVPYEESFSELNGLAAKAPIISFHATPHLVAKVLTQAIETLAKMYLSPEFPSICGLRHNIETDLVEEWKRCIRPLLKCLNALETTTWGSHIARNAIQGLMQQFGDILSECWLTTAATAPLVPSVKADGCRPETENQEWDLETYPFLGLGDTDSFVTNDIWLAT